MRYFPLQNDRFEHQFGIRALPPGESIIEITECYDQEISLKRELVESDPDNYFQFIEGNEVALEEAAEHLIAAVAAEPTTATKSVASRGENALLTAALSIQEDIVVLNGFASEGFPTIGGVVCFPSGWSIRDKIGMPVLQVHQSVPQYAEVMANSTDRLLQQLKPARPVWRMNWGVRLSDRLDQSPKHAEAVANEVKQLTGDNAAERCFFRVERQTLSRLPNSNAILFTIHTHQCPIGQLEAWQKQNLIGVLQTCPPATLDYKGITPIAKHVLAALERSA